MHARVTAILVARNGAAYLPRTLAALQAQQRRPDALIAVDADSRDGSAELLAAAGPTQFVTVPGKTTFGAAIGRALHVAAPAAEPDEWLWLLSYDNAPEPGALAQLLAAVEVAPSVAIAGPKQMRWDEPGVIASFGETMTGFGASIRLVEGELDQAQHDVQDDVLAVGQAGMLVRRSLWAQLGGFDPGLPTVDAALDFSIRARLAGFRVVVVPSARVASAGGPELFGRPSVSARHRARAVRSAQLHRRLVYASGAALVIHWLSLVPLGLLRSLGHLLAKRPWLIGGELSSAVGAAVDRGVGVARRTLRRSRRVGWGAISPLRMPAAQVRERRAQTREASAPLRVQSAATPASFLGHGGLAVLLIAMLAGLIGWGQLLGGAAVTGGGFAPLGSVAGLWSNLGYGWREVAGGFVGAADPFAAVLAVLGSLTFWAPSYSLVLLCVLALPLSALGAWLAARRVSERPWSPALAALLWALAPPLLAGISFGHPGAVLAHVLLPWLVLAALGAARSWSSAAAAALLFAGIVAGAPSLGPALLLAWFALLVSRPAGLVKLLGMPVPALALFAPLVVQQLGRGTPLALLADPGPPVAGAQPTGWQLALLDPAGGLSGWDAALAALALPGLSAPLVVAVLLAPVAALALLALFLPGSRRAIPSLVLALLGLATAVIGSRIELASAGAEPVALWAGSGLSLFWLGLLGAAMVALDSLGRATFPAGMLAAATSGILAVPLIAGLYLGTSSVEAGSERMLPAVVTAEAQSRPGIGTLVIAAAPGGGISARIERGAGTTLDDWSTLATTQTESTAALERIAQLAGNLVSRSGLDARAALAEAAVDFVVLRPGGDPAVLQRSSDALDGNPALSPVGQTASGRLWRLDGGTLVQAERGPGPLDSSLGRAVLIGQGVVVGLTLLLGIPTSRRARRGSADDPAAGVPAATFEEQEEDHG